MRTEIVDGSVHLLHTFQVPSEVIFATNRRSFRYMIDKLPRIQRSMVADGETGCTPPEVPVVAVICTVLPPTAFQTDLKLIKNKVKKKYKLCVTSKIRKNQNKSKIKDTPCR